MAKVKKDSRYRLSKKAASRGRRGKAKPQPKPPAEVGGTDQQVDQSKMVRRSLVLNDDEITAVMGFGLGRIGALPPCTLLSVGLEPAENGALVRVIYLPNEAEIARLQSEANSKVADVPKS